MADVPAHYAVLLRVDHTPLAAMPSQYDPRYATRGDVAVRDLGIYERFAASTNAEVAA